MEAAPIPPAVCLVGSSGSDDEGPVVEDIEKGSAPADTPLCSSPSFGSVSTVPPASPPRSLSEESSSPVVSPSRPPSHIHPSNLKTPQMMVLGKDGSDYLDLMASRAKQQNERQQALLQEEKTEQFSDEPASIEQAGEGSKSSWWNRLWHGKNKDNSPETKNHEYTSMDHAEGTPSRRPQQHQHQQPMEGDVEAPVYYQGLDEDPLHSPPPPPPGKMHRSILRNLPLPSTKEEQIQQDCSFLYRPVEEDKKTPKRTLRAILDPPPEGVSTLYRDAQDVLSPPVMAQYKAKYHQLNQEYKVPDEEDRFADYNDYAVTPAHELSLEEQQEAQTHNQALVSSAVAQSSLFYQHEANGRVVLRLPRDHVRLLVANSGELEPGILSVIQCRGPDDPQASNLEYCLTVPPNLYQQVVSEMTQYTHVSAHQNGLDESFYASDHADIRWAIGIMVVIMIILGINTLVFGLD